MSKVKCAIIGSGNIGTDLMLKIIKTSQSLSLNGVIGIDPESEGLAMAKSHNIAISSTGLQGFMEMDEYQDTEIFFDATSAGAHKNHHDLIINDGKQMIDLTPAAIGPYCVPVVNLTEHLKEKNVNMVTCGGQATIPMVAAVNQVSSVKYAEIVASVSSKSAGPGPPGVRDCRDPHPPFLQCLLGQEPGRTLMNLLKQPSWGLKKLEGQIELKQS